MRHQYLLTLEIVPLEVGAAYDELPSHLTLMSRFWSDLLPSELADIVRPLFARMNRMELYFGETIVLGPKKLVVHTVEQPEELRLHGALCKLLESIGAVQRYPQFIGVNHRPHVTKRESVYFNLGDRRVAAAAYLIEIVNKQRVVRAKFALGVS